MNVPSNRESDEMRGAASFAAWQNERRYSVSPWKPVYIGRSRFLRSDSVGLLTLPVSVLSRFESAS